MSTGEARRPHVSRRARTSEAPWDPVHGLRGGSSTPVMSPVHGEGSVCRSARSPVSADGRGPQIPHEPSRVSRMMSACPAWRAVSSIRWNITYRTLHSMRSERVHELSRSMDSATARESSICPRYLLTPSFTVSSSPTMKVDWCRPVTMGQSSPDSRPPKITANQRRSQMVACFTSPRSDKELAVGARRAVASSSPWIFLIKPSRWHRGSFPGRHVPRGANRSFWSLDIS
jgi:hypothetical protein